MVKNAGVDRGSLGCIGLARGSENTFTLASVRDEGMDFHRAIDASDMVVDSKQQDHLIKNVKVKILPPARIELATSGLQDAPPSYVKYETCALAN